MTIRSTPPQAVDPDRLSLMLSGLRLPSIETEWRILAQRADKEGWPASTFLFSLAELELTERDNRRLDRHTRQAKLFPSKKPRRIRFQPHPVPAQSTRLEIILWPKRLLNRPPAELLCVPIRQRWPSILSNLQALSSGTSRYAPGRQPYLPTAMLPYDVFLRRRPSPPLNLPVPTSGHIGCYPKRPKCHRDTKPPFT